jgi:hypothetical protein
MVLSMIQKSYPDREIELMQTYCDEITQPKNIKVALEYAHIKRIKQTSEKLIHKAFQISDETNAWAKIYKLQLDAQVIHEIDRLKQIKDLPGKTNEMNITTSILTMYAFYNTGKYEVAYDYIERIRPQIVEVKDPYLRKAYAIRLGEVEAHICLKQLKNVVGAREMANRILDANLGPTYNSTGYFILALSYLSESYESSFSYYQKCLEINEKLNRVSVADDLKEQIAFLQLLWDKSVDRSLSPFINNLADGKHVQSSDPFQQALAFFYLGRKESRIDQLFLSLHHFGKLKDYFRAELPKLELIKRNIPAEAF